MKQSQKKQKLCGADGFDQYYRRLFGARWDALKCALQGESDYAEWNAGGDETYFLDAASVRAALALPLENAPRILDMCAAPGGKMLVLARAMHTDARLLANERSLDRMRRLRNVCDTCLPAPVRQRVTVTCHDGARMCRTQAEAFDAILLDAPCSSERHVLADAKYLAEWSPSRIKTLALAQWALLSSAWRMLARGGYLLYATCALSPAENDDTVARLLKKFPDAQICTPDIASGCYKTAMARGKALPAYEKTAFGAQILPDVAGGAGPLYFSLLKKIEDRGSGTA